MAMAAAPKTLEELAAMADALATSEQALLAANATSDSARDLLNQLQGVLTATPGAA